MHVSRVLALAAASVLLALPLPAAAAPGDLDPTFSGDGRTTVSFPGGAEAVSVAMQGTKAIVGGTTTLSGNSDLGVTRLTAGGKLDTTFGNHGRVRIDVFGQRDSLGELAVLANGKIVVVGAAEKGSGSRIVVVRLMPDGRFDRSFGGDGIVITDPPGVVAGAAAVVPLSDGRLAVGGSAGDFEAISMIVLRYRADGRLDRSFGGDGMSFAGFATRPTTSLVDLVRWGSSDWLLALAEAGGDSGFDIGLASFRDDGAPDPSFGGAGGKALEDIGPYDYASALIPRSQGAFLVVGQTDPAGGWDAMLARFNASGHLDVTWGGGDGVVLRDAGTDLEYWRGGTTMGKKLVLVGQIDGHAAVARFRGGGAPDPAFGAGGYAVTPFSGGESTLRGVVVAGGAIVAAGKAPATLVYDGFAVERLLGT